jgi:hypothetical protein
MSDKHSLHHFAPEPPADRNPDLTEADEQFFLGLYRCAVNEYQPKIERRTQISIGPILVRNYREIDQDFMQNLNRIEHSWINRLFFRSRIKTRLQQWRDYLKSTHQERAASCMASYHRNAIYVSFSKGTNGHEFGIAFGVVHELSHALWERLAGQPLFPRPKGNRSELEKFKLLVEGYATYAERIWFLDVYPSSVRKFANDPRLKVRGVYAKGMKRVKELVEQHGPQILFEIPKRWREF